MTNTLGLVGDGDDVDLILDIERAFAVSVSDETSSWYTVGDVHAALLGRFEAAGDIPGGLCHGVGILSASEIARGAIRPSQTAHRHGNSACQVLASRPNFPPVSERLRLADAKL